MVIIMMIGDVGEKAKDGASKPLMSLNQSVTSRYRELSSFF